MIFEIGIENNVEGRSIAWGLGYPGLFVYGEDGKTALMKMPEAISRYVAWITEHINGQSWIDDHEPDIRHVETWETYQIDESYQLVDHGYEINAWFLSDWRPLTAEDVEQGQLLLSWSREDLLKTVADLLPEKLQETYPGERWSIAGILRHIGGAEWWYLDRLGLAFPRDQVPKDPFERLLLVRTRFGHILSDLVGVDKVLGIDGEIWSPRKMLRRAVWHERDHADHIRGLLPN